MALNPKYMITPILQEQYVDPATGEPLSNGGIYTYIDTDRSTFKPAYTIVESSPGNYTFSPLPQPIPLNGAGIPVNGSGADIKPYYYPYDESGNIQNYYIVVKNEAGQTRLTRAAWPNMSEESSQQNVWQYNFIRNGTFYSWNNATLYSDIVTKTFPDVLSDYVVDDWSYQLDDTTQFVNISRGEFVAGDEFVDDNPPYYLIYENTNTGSGASSVNRFMQTYENVQTLSGNEVTAGVWLYRFPGSNFSTMSLSLIQYFGTGGSPSPENPIPIRTISASQLPEGEWTKIIGSATVPSISGQTIGTNKDSKLILCINMPQNVTAKIGVSTSRMESGSTLIGTQETSNDDVSRGTNAYTLYPPFRTGDVKMTLRLTADQGWLLMNDGTIGNNGSGATVVGLSCYALFKLIWENVHSGLYAPIYDDQGVPSVYGGSAKEDWDAYKRLSLTRALGRVLSGYNPTPSPIISRTYTASNDGGSLLLTLDSTIGFYTGNPVKVSTTGSFPGGLDGVTTYYANVFDSTSIYLYDTEANAVAGGATGVKTWSSNGSPVNTIYTVNTAHPLGQFLGEDQHSLTTAQLASHAHEAKLDSSATPGAGGQITRSNVSSFTLTVNTEFTGSSQAHNNIQPTTYMNVMIKL